MFRKCLVSKTQNEPPPASKNLEKSRYQNLSICDTIIYTRKQTNKLPTWPIRSSGAGCDFFRDDASKKSENGKSLENLKIDFPPNKAQAGHFPPFSSSSLRFSPADGYAISERLENKIGKASPWRKRLFCRFVRCNTWGNRFGELTDFLERAKEFWKQF